MGIPPFRNQRRKPRACVVSWKPSEEVSRNKVNRRELKIDHLVYQYRDHCLIEQIISPKIENLSFQWESSLYFRMLLNVLMGDRKYTEMGITIAVIGPEVLCWLIR